MGEVTAAVCRCERVYAIIPDRPSGRPNMGALRW
jgi:hypothetical protein